MLWVTVGILFLFSALIAQYAGIARIGFLLFLSSIYIFPLSINHVAIDRHVGVAPGSIAVTTYGVILFAAIGLCLARREHKKWPVEIFISIGALILGSIIFWSVEPEIISGTIHYTTGFIAILVGISAWNRLVTQPGGLLFVATSVLALLLLQAGVVAAQLLGMAVPYYGASTYAGAIARPGGTFGHPGNLGKVLVLTTLLVLPLVSSLSRKIRVRAQLCVAICLLLIAITYSRANIAAIMLVVAGWLLLQGFSVRNAGRTMVISILVILFSLPFIDTFIQRFRIDPEGGERPRLAAEAYKQISRSPWLGVGPNNYVEVVGEYGRAAASGLPVHNVALLWIAECGVIITMAMFLPFVALAVHAVRARKSTNITKWSARAILAGIPAVILIGSTGWGLVSHEIWPFFGFVIGCLWSGLFQDNQIIKRGKWVATDTHRTLAVEV